MTEDETGLLDHLLKTMEQHLLMDEMSAQRHVKKGLKFPYLSFCDVICCIVESSILLFL